MTTAYDAIICDATGAKVTQYNFYAETLTAAVQEAARISATLFPGLNLITHQIYVQSIFLMVSGYARGAPVTAPRYAAIYRA